jgi:hypothetical protein
MYERRENVAGQDKSTYGILSRERAGGANGSLRSTQKLLRTFTIEFQDQDQQTIQLQLQNLTFQSPPKTAVKSIDPPVHQTNHPNVSSIKSAACAVTQLNHTNFAQRTDISAS